MLSEDSLPSLFQGSQSVAGPPTSVKPSHPSMQEPDAVNWSVCAGGSFMHVGVTLSCSQVSQAQSF